MLRFKAGFAILAVTFCIGFSGRADAQSQTPDEVYAEVHATLGVVPGFIKEFPEAGIQGAWEELKLFYFNQNSALSPKMKELIGLAVSAQIPSKHGVYIHTEFGKFKNVSESEMKEAIGMSAITRHWSTFLNGLNLSELEFRTETDRMIAYVKQNTGEARPEIEIDSPERALQDIQGTFGLVPTFLNKFPRLALVGAWREMKQLQLNPNTKLSGKEKELIGLAVSAQIPCRYCVYIHTEVAKLHGATEQELSESLAMASIVRHWATVASRVSFESFQADILTILRHLKQRPSR